jgi:transposase
MPEISRDEYEKLKEEIRVLKALVASLTAEIIELKAKSGKNSKNSSKPPSSDGLKKGNVKNSRKPSGKKSGGQEHHEGTTKELNPEPDKIVTLIPKEDCDCGGKVVVQSDRFTVRQVVDIVPVQEITVEYRAQNGICAACGKVHKASFPAGVEGVVSYGENIRAIATYLANYQLIPLKRAAELMEDLFGLKVSQGAILSSVLEAYGKLAAAEKLVKEEIIQSDIVHFDESGMRVKGKTQWIHSVGTKTCTLYGIHKKRGKEAMDEMGILPKYRGTAVHDHWKSYYHYDQCAHAECNAHHLRHLKYLHEDLGETWAEEMACLLLRIKQHIDLNRCFGANRLEQADIGEYMRKYREILENAVPQASKEAQRMVRRMKKYEQETLLFMLDFDVPFTNNLAERDIRMPKAKQKISGGFRSDEGAKAFARIRGFISTTKKKGKQALDGLVAVFEGNAVDFLYTANS